MQQPEKLTKKPRLIHPDLAASDLTPEERQRERIKERNTANKRAWRKCMKEEQAQNQQPADVDSQDKAPQKHRRITHPEPQPDAAALSNSARDEIPIDPVRRFTSGLYTRTHAFHPGGTAPSITNPDSDLVATAPQAGGPSSTAATANSITSSTPVHSTAMSTAAGSNASNSTHMLSIQPPSTTLVSSPPSKKPQMLVVFQNSRITKISSAAKAVKITPAVGVVGMQGTINWLTDVFKWFVRGGPDGVQGSEDLIMQVIKILEGEESDILLDQQAALITIISLKGNEHYLKFYVTLQEACICGEADWLVT
ncbi:hypothetical protein BDR07DRAFT_1489332 [Suillus spraguei]|nr:hypothetical protein BDR07DRAFT_1489332 [Suillus spraguei]